MITVNDSFGSDYVNGSIGTITDIKTENPLVEIRLDNGKDIILNRYVRAVSKQVVEEKEKKIDVIVEGKPQKRTVIEESIARKEVGSFSQFPLKLAWAISIHKSQGQTFEKINIDPCCWEPGQFYVAASRAKSIKGIRFIRPIKQTYLKAFSKADEKLLKESFNVE